MKMRTVHSVAIVALGSVLLAAPLASASSEPVMRVEKAEAQHSVEGQDEDAQPSSSDQSLEERRREATANHSGRPPKVLKRLSDGHWSAWDPPAPPEGSTVHTVSQGDTFWDLAQQTLKNPYLWPQIWDHNRYVSDSHWIYPGDPIVLVSPEVVPTEGSPSMMWGPTAGGDDDSEEMAYPDSGTSRSQATAQPARPREYPIGDMQDLYCAPHIESSELPEDPRIVAAEDEELVGMGQGHIVYVSAGRDNGYKPGDRFTIVRDSGKIRHPATRDVLGRRVDGVGMISIIAVQDHSATAQITFSCQDMLADDRVVPLREYSVPSRPYGWIGSFERYDPDPSGKPVGFVIASKDPQKRVGEGSVVSVDLGDGEGVRPGDVLTVFRPNPSGEELPRLNLGQAVVLLTEGSSSIARITLSVREIEVGDNVEIR